MSGPLARRNPGADPYAGVKVVVLGAAGFIGRSVAAALHLRGADTVPVVRSAAAAAGVFASPRLAAALVSCDLAAPAAVARLLQQERPAVVFNLAGYGVDPSERAEGPAFAINARLVGTVCETMTALEAPAWDGQRIVHAGSALEYGAAGGSLVETTTARPTTVYGRSKLEGTRLLRHHCASAGLCGVSVRLFTVYGPGELAGRLLPTLLAAAGGTGSVHLSAGLQRRDFTYVGDVADGLLRLGVAGMEPGAIVNLATGRLTSVRTFAETAAAVLGIAPARLRFGARATRPEEMEHDEVDVSRLETLTGWRPRTTLAEGIERTAALAGGSRSTADATLGAGR